MRVFIVHYVMDGCDINNLSVYSNRKDALIEVIKNVYRDDDDMLNKLLKMITDAETDDEIDTVDSEIDWNDVHLQSYRVDKGVDKGVDVPTNEEDSA